MKVRIARAARRTGLGYARINGFWYLNAKVTADELTALRQAAAGKKDSRHGNGLGTKEKDIWEYAEQLRDELVKTQAELAALRAEFERASGEEASGRGIRTDRSSAVPASPSVQEAQARD